VKELLKIAPKITDFLKKDSLEFYNQVKTYLEIMGISYKEDPTLVRGLDYYSHTVWEFVDGSGRTQDAFGGGGRYDQLSKNIGHKEAIPAVGFALGMERVVEAIMDAGITLRNKDALHLYFLQLGQEATMKVLPISLQARDR
jgi:histidyl-tRNA synthetase